jgi:hypothetical protein
MIAFKVVIQQQQKKKSTSIKSGFFSGGKTKKLVFSREENYFCYFIIFVCIWLWDDNILFELYILKYCFIN